MRTRTQIENEALRLEERVRALRDVESISAPSTAVPLGSVTVFTFPESLVKSYAPRTPEILFTLRILRSIDFVGRPAGTEYALMEEVFVSNAKGEPVRHYDSFEVSRHGSALEALTDGLQRADEDRLSASIVPLVQRIDAEGFTIEEENDAMEQVARFTSEFDLSVTSRMRIKSDAIDLFEGRLELGDFVARTVARQECFRSAQQVEISRAVAESFER